MKELEAVSVNMMVGHNRGKTAHHKKTFAHGPTETDLTPDHISKQTIIYVIVNGHRILYRMTQSGSASVFIHIRDCLAPRARLGAEIVMLAAVVSVVVSVAWAQPTNLLVNPSFENQSPAPWRLAPAAFVTQEDSVEGGRALALTAGATASQTVALRAGEYELRAFVRTGPAQTVQLKLTCDRGLQSEVSTGTRDPSSPAPSQMRETDWRELHAPLLFLSDSESCSVSVQLSGNGETSALVDSLSLTRHRNLLRNPRLLRAQKGWKMAGVPRVSEGPVLFNRTDESDADNDSWLLQTVQLVPGNYTLSASYRSSGGQSLARLEAKGCGPQDAVLNLAPTPFGDAYRRVQLRGLQIRNPRCTVGVHVRSGHHQWLRVSDLTLELDAHSYEMIAGGDVSLTDLVEQYGGIYKLDGTPADPFHILASSGMNLARLHLFVDPGNSGFSPSRNMQGSYDDLADILHLATRAHSAGMRIELSLHLSDYWADGDCQTMPHAWLGLSADALVDTVSAYVGSVLRSFHERGIAVDYVAIGNEADSGLLRTLECKSPLLPVNADATTNPELLSRIYEAGYRAIHAASPETLVLWHLANIGRYIETRRYIDAMLSRGTHVDVLAYSAYPYWSRQSVRQFQDFANYVTARYHRLVFFEETGYPWAAAAGADNMTNGGTEPYPLTPHGQLDFLNDEIDAIQSADQGNILGFAYWDATWIPAPHTFDNVDNYVLFDRAGNALPALTIGFRLRLPAHCTTCEAAPLGPSVGPSTNCVGAMLCRGLPSASSETAAKCSSRISFRRDNR
jgi:arabinogalactan endo-1,4-beta-galactosidase